MGCCIIAGFPFDNTWGLGTKTVLASGAGSCLVGDGSTGRDIRSHVAWNFSAMPGSASPTLLWLSSGTGRDSSLPVVGVNSATVAVVESEWPCASLTLPESLRLVGFGVGECPRQFCTAFCAVPGNRSSAAYSPAPTSSVLANCGNARSHVMLMRSPSSVPERLGCDLSLTEASHSTQRQGCLVPSQGDPALRDEEPPPSGGT